MLKPQFTIGAGLVALVASVALYGSFEPPAALPVLSATAMPPESSPQLQAAVVLGESSGLPVVLGGDPLPVVLGGAPIRPVLGGDSARPVLGGDPVPSAASAPAAAPADEAARAARRLLALLPREDCPQLIRFADDQSDRYRGQPSAQALVNALEAAQQFCYQRERFPEIARERRQEAERFAERFLAGGPRHSALRR